MVTIRARIELQLNHQLRGYSRDKNRNDSLSRLNDDVYANHYAALIPGISA